MMEELMKHSLKWPDSSYESHVVTETRLLVESSHPIHTKVALLESAIANEERHVLVLEQGLAIADEKRRTRLQTALELRRRAIAHFRMTAKSLVVQSEGEGGLGRYHTVANGHQAADGELQFMEYSS